MQFNFAYVVLSRRISLILIRGSLELLILY